MKTLLLITSFSLATIGLQGCDASLKSLSNELASGSNLSRPVVFQGINVVSVDSNKILPHQTVMVRNGLITHMANASELRLPDTCEIIDGTGKYLLPGLIDMHVHISDDKDLLLLLANGVTTVRNMADVPWWLKTFMGFSNALSLRQMVRDNEVLGPEIYTAGYVLDGSPPVSPFHEKIVNAEDAITEIVRQKSKGYDFIKIYDMLSPESFRAIMTTAKRNGMTVVGHVPFQIAVDTVLDSDVRSIEHLTGYINNNKADFIVPHDKLQDFALRTKKSGIYNCPTLVVWDKLPPENGVDSLRRHEEFQFLSWRVKWLWKQSLSTVYEIEYVPKDKYRERMMTISKEMTKLLYASQCKLLVGTDMNFVGVFPGISTLREIELLVETGVAPFDALRAATINAAECLGKEDRFGSIAQGKRADLVLLDGNPVADIKNIYSVRGVMAKGIWLEKQQIMEKLTR